MYTGLCGRTMGLMGGSGWLGAIAGLLLFVAVALGVAALIVYLVKRSRGPVPAKADVPQDLAGILDARYARGELSREEYLQMREDLGTE